MNELRFGIQIHNIYFFKLREKFAKRQKYEIFFVSKDNISKSVGIFLNRDS